MLRKAVLLGILTLAMLSVVVVPTYAYLSRYQSRSSATSWAYREVSTGLQVLGRNMRAPNLLAPNCFRGFKSPWIEVSEEFEQKVMGIANSDPDVQDLLNNGYNVTSVMPIIKTTVQGNGIVSIKATGAIVTLTKEKVGWASVEVDLETGKVTRISTVSRTVIEKSP